MMLDQLSASLTLSRAKNSPSRCITTCQGPLPPSMSTTIVTFPPSQSIARPGLAILALASLCSTRTSIQLGHCALDRHTSAQRQPISSSILRPRMVPSRAQNVFGPQGAPIPSTTDSLRNSGGTQTNLALFIKRARLGLTGGARALRGRPGAQEVQTVIADSVAWLTVWRGPAATLTCQVVLAFTATERLESSILSLATRLPVQFGSAGTPTRLASILLLLHAVTIATVRPARQKDPTLTFSSSCRPWPPP